MPAHIGKDDVLINSATPWDRDAFEAALRLEAATFVEAGYVSDIASHHYEYALYNESTTFYIARQGLKVVGSLRVLEPGGKGLKTLNDWSVPLEGRELAARVEHYDPKSRFVFTQACRERLVNLQEVSVAEIGTVAVRPEFRGRSNGVAERLYHAALRGSLERHSHWVAAIDNALLVAFRESGGFPFWDIGESREYLGSETTPVLMDLEAVPRYVVDQARIVRGCF